MASSTRTAGLILAIVVLVVFAGVVTFFVVRSPAVAPAPTTFSGPAPTPDPTLVPAKGEAGAPTRFGGGQGFYLQVVDKDDPTVVRAELSAERSTPIEGQTFRVALEKPVIWAFLKDGRTLFARADRGTAYIPDQAKGKPSMPQDGVLEGNVLVKLFEAREGTIRPDPVNDDALLVGKTTTVKFDSELGQAEAPEKVTLIAEGVDFSGMGVTVLFNQVQQRIDLLHIAHTDFVTLAPEALGREQKRKPAPKKATGELAGKMEKAAGAGGGTPVKAAAKDAPIETLYRLVCTDTVKVTQGERTIESDVMEGWARVVDNQLRPGAVMMSNAGPAVARDGGKAGAGKTGGNASTAKSSTSPTASGSTQASEGQTLATASNQPVTITWKGPLELKPLASKSPELDYNDVVVRFTSQGESGVTFRDAKAKALAQGNLLEYGATRREVALAGKGPTGARLTSGSDGYATAERFDMSLVTGTARVSGPGLIQGLAKDGRPDRGFAWDKEAQFQFKKDAKGEVTQVLTKVNASGAARATDLKSSIGGDTLIAALVPVNEQQSRLDTLTLIGKARGQDDKGGSLDAERIDVAFVATPGKPEQSDPVTLIAEGSVKGQRKADVLESKWLKADIARVADEQGVPQLTATGLEARDATYTGENNVTASAPLLKADPVARIARLTGRAGSVKVNSKGSTIAGQDMAFHEVERTLVVTGPGTIDHAAAVKEGEPASRTVATWTREMTFNDIPGTVTCDGEATAEVTKTMAGALVEKDTMTADVVELDLTPGSEASGAANPEDSRQLLRARIRGSLASRADGTAAKIEARRYAAGAVGGAANAAPVLERLMFLESARINADNEKGTLVVPTPGKLLFVDRREAEKRGNAGANQGNPLEGGDPRGTALFTWSGSMDLARGEGLVTLRESVRLTHQRPEDPQRSELECETLVAKVRETGAPGDAAKGGLDESVSGELVSADATGAVWMRYGGRELVADAAHYDALRRVLNAKASGANTVQVFDPKGQPMNAKEIVWDLVKDRIEISRPGPVTTPAPRR